MPEKPENKLPLSIFIITQNEEDRIEAAINSVSSFADEVIIIDSGSTDDTMIKAEKLGAKVIHNDWVGYGQQKRFAEEQCKNDWLLNIDADERVTSSLVDEIRTIFEKPEHQENSGYRTKILDLYPHEKTPSRHAYQYNVVRLYNKNKGRYADSLVHDRVSFDADMNNVPQLEAPIYHYSIRSLSSWVDKLNRYSDLQVDDMLSRQKNVSKARLFIEFPAAFFKSYILRKNIFFGHYGLTAAYIYAFGRHLRLAKRLERGMPNHISEDI